MLLITNRMAYSICAIITAVSCCGCSPSGSKKASEPQQRHSISVVIPVTIDAFTQFEGSLRKRLEGSVPVVNAYSAEGDPTKFDVIVRRALRDDPDVLVTVGTQLTNTAFGPQFVNDLPAVIASCISDPPKVESLVAVGLDPPRSSAVAIVSDNPAVDIYEQSAVLLEEMLGGDAVVGVLFTPGEINSENTAGKLMAATERRGMRSVRGTLTGPADVSPVTESLIVRGADVIVIPHDKAATTAAATVVKLAMEASPASRLVFALDDGTVRASGAAVAVSVNYGDLGTLTAERVLATLQGDSPASMPIAQQDQAKIYLNKVSLEALGIDVNAEHFSGAVVYDGDE